jgi:hypothetical protein
MSRDDLGSHEQGADQLRSRVATTGLTDPALRLGALARGGGGAAIPEPYDALVRQVGEDSSRVTDAQVQRVRDSAGSEKAAFELVLTAAIGAGLRRWDAAEEVIKEAGNAAP